jgi:hypothetical protein
MKPVLKAFALAVALAASHSALSNDSPFPSAADVFNQPALDTYADWHARNGTLMAGSAGSPFPSSDEAIDRALPPLDTYADRHARNGTSLAGSGTPFPVDIEPGLGQPPLDTYADRYAREHAAPTSAEVDAAKLSVGPSGRS